MITFEICPLTMMKNSNLKEMMSVMCKLASYTQKSIRLSITIRSQSHNICHQRSFCIEP
jgi:hypothetical protein